MRRSAALMLIVMCAQTAAAHTDIETQLASVTRKLESRPNDYSLYLVRGELKRHSQDWLGAEADFARADQLGSAEIQDQLELYRGRLFEDDAAGNRSVETTISATTNPATVVPNNSSGGGAMDLLFLIGLAVSLGRRAVRNP